MVCNAWNLIYLYNGKQLVFDGLFTITIGWHGMSKPWFPVREHQKRLLHELGSSSHPPVVHLVGDVLKGQEVGIVEDHLGPSPSRTNPRRHPTRWCLRDQKPWWSVGWITDDWNHMTGCSIWLDGIRRLPFCENSSMLRTTMEDGQWDPPLSNGPCMSLPEILQTGDGPVGLCNQPHSSSHQR